jgi:hypothetical protein
MSHPKQLALDAMLMMLALASCDRTPAAKPSRAAVFLGERATGIVDSADRIDVFRIESTGRWREKKDDDRSFAGYPLLATAKPQGREYILRLANILKDDSNYEWGFNKQCGFNPGIGYRIWSGNASFIVVICLQCDDIGVIPDETNPTNIHIQSADHARPALLQLAKQAFPDDKELAALKDEHH